MFYIIAEKDRKDRTWEEICNDFPECHLALESPHNTMITHTGGIIVAYSVPYDLDSRSEITTFVIKNNLWLINTYPESGVLWECFM